MSQCVPIKPWQPSPHMLAWLNTLSTKSAQLAQMRELAKKSRRDGHW